MFDQTTITQADEDLANRIIQRVQRNVSELVGAPVDVSQKGLAHLISANRREAVQQATSKLQAVNERLLSFVKDVAEQHLIDEMEDPDGDYEFAYEVMVKGARAAMLRSSGEPVSQPCKLPDQNIVAPAPGAFGDFVKAAAEDGKLVRIGNLPQPDTDAVDAVARAICRAAITHEVVGDVSSAVLEQMIENLTVKYIPEAKAALATMPTTQRAREEGWQPIETVPAETPVLIYSPNASGTGVMVGIHVQGSDERYWVDEVDGEIIDVEPTHWQPQPDTQAIRAQVQA